MDSVHEFLEACERDDVEAVRKLIDQGLSVDVTDNDDITGLQMAAANGSATVAAELIARGASLEIHNTYGWTPLLHAARHGHNSVVALLLQNNADTHACTDFGLNALILAAHHGHQAVCKLLLDAGMDPVGSDVVGVSRSACEFTPLMFASHRGHDAVVKCLLDGIWGGAWSGGLRKFCDIQPNAINDRLKQNTSRAGAGPAGSRGNIAVGSSSESNTDKGDSKLSSNGIKSNVELGRGWTRDGYIDRDAMNPQRSIPLGDLWSDEGNWINSATDINHRTPSHGVNALMLAALAGHMTTAQMLVERGANANLTNVNGHTALDVAQLSGQREVQGYLERKTTYRDRTVAREPKPDIIEATCQGDIERVRNILDRDPSQRDAQSSADGATPLMYAAIARKLDLARLLVESGCDVNKQDSVNGWTALMQAIVHGGKAVALYLISVGADVSITAKNGCTAFDMVTFIEDVDTELYRLLAAKSVQAPQFPCGSSPGDKTSTGTVPSVDMNGTSRLNQRDVDSSKTNLKAWWSRMSDRFRNMKLGRTFNQNRLGPLQTLNEHQESGSTLRDADSGIEEEDLLEEMGSKKGSIYRSGNSTARSTNCIASANKGDMSSTAAAGLSRTAAGSVNNVSGLDLFSANTAALDRGSGMTLGGQTLIGMSTMSRSLLQLPSGSAPPFMPPPCLPVDRTQRMPPLVVNPRSTSSKKPVTTTNSGESLYPLGFGQSPLGPSNTKLLYQSSSLFANPSANQTLATPSHVKFAPPFTDHLNTDYNKERRNKDKNDLEYTSRSHRTKILDDDDVTNHRKRVVLKDYDSNVEKTSERRRSPLMDRSSGAVQRSSGAIQRSDERSISKIDRLPTVQEKSSTEVSPSASSESSVLSSVISSGTSHSRLTSSSSTLTATSQRSGSGGGSGRRSGGSRGSNKPGRSPGSKGSASTLTPSPSPQPSITGSGKAKGSRVLQDGAGKQNDFDEEFEDDDAALGGEKLTHDHGFSKDDDMASVLQKLSLEKYRPIFEEQEISDLCELGVSHAESRREIVQAIQELNAGKDRERLQQHQLLIQYSVNSASRSNLLATGPATAAAAADSLLIGGMQAENGAEFEEV